MGNSCKTCSYPFLRPIQREINRVWESCVEDFSPMFEVRVRVEISDDENSDVENSDVESRQCIHQHRMYPKTNMLMMILRQVTCINRLARYVCAP